MIAARTALPRARGAFDGSNTRSSNRRINNTGRLQR